MINPFPTLKTSRFVMRQFTETDQEDVFRGLSDPEVTRYYGVSFLSLESTAEQMQWFVKHEKKGTGIWWVITSPDDNIFIGAAGINDIKKEHGKAELGFWLLPEFWGKGIIKEVVPVICDYGFKTLNLHRLEAWVETENSNSKRVLGKLDFALEGTLRECEIKNGRFISLHVFSKLASEQ